MQRDAFREWLQNNTGIKKSTINTRLYDVAKVEKVFGDLDRHFEEDECSSVMDALRSPEGIEAASDDPDLIRSILAGPAAYRSHLKSYISFLKGELFNVDGNDLDHAEKAHENRKFWIEKTLVSKREDRIEGPHKLGEALWSPQKSKDGKDIYKNMRDVGRGDIVLHLIDNKKISGVSVVADKVDDTFQGIEGSDWEGECYRIPLKAYVELSPAIGREELFGDPVLKKVLLDIINAGGDLFYNRKLELNQGKYLTPAPGNLIRALNEYYYEHTGKHLPHIPLRDSGEKGSKNMSKTNLSYPLNQILYGPPGTGKTYNTARIAVEICNGTAPSERSELMEEYNKLVVDKRIAFTTFHQSIGYEEFVEGLRPVVGDDSESNQASSGFSLKPEPGIFYEMCTQANEVQGTSGESGQVDLENRSFFKMSLGQARTEGHIYDAAVEEGYIYLGWGGDKDWSDPKYKHFPEVREAWREIDPDASSNSGNIQQVWAFRGNMKVGDIVVVSDGNLRFRAIGEVLEDYEYVPSDTVWPHRRKVRWLKVLDESLPIDTIYEKQLSQVSCYELQSALIKKAAISKLIAPGAKENYVLIIDEINRANISKVFGELITLIEPDKRLGAADALRVTLPYSKKRFGVPGNLYIIGTMNTADRSIALLDTALRRRFDFQEMMPDYTVLDDREVEGIHLGTLLRAINTRIEWLFDREHQVGHSFFVKVETKQKLDKVMRRNIIPLMKEYFYDDWQKIRAVLNDQGGCFVSVEHIAPPAGIDDDGEERFRYTDTDGDIPLEAYHLAMQL
jgi:5-methylcytosine-specific restriction protein B